MSARFSLCDCESVTIHSLVRSLCDGGLNRDYDFPLPILHALSQRPYGWMNGWTLDDGVLAARTFF